MSKISIVFYFLLWGLFTESISAQNSVGPCEFSPGNLTTAGIGPTWATITWGGAQTGLTYEVTLLDSFLSPLKVDTTSNNYHTFYDLDPGRSYFIQVVVLCSEGNRSAISRIEIITIIIDLALEFEGNFSPSNEPICEELVSNAKQISEFHCPFVSEINRLFLAEFIRIENMKRIKFIIQQTGPLHFVIYNVSQNGYNGDKDKGLSIVSNNDLEQESKIKHIKVKLNYNNSQVSLGNFSIGLGSNNFFDLIFTLSHEIEQRDPYLIYLFPIENYSFGADRMMFTNPLSSPSILPNPTTTTLQIQIPTIFTTQIQGTLLNLSGAVVQRYGLEPGVNTVSTANLSPGIYFLRLEGPGYAETFKVVKVE